MKIQFSKVSIGQEEIDAVSRVLKSGWLCAATETEAFEKEFAKYVGVKYAIFTNSCTSALKMAYKWAKEQGYTGIYYPINTFCATYSAAAEIGLDLYVRGCYTGGIKEIICQKLNLSATIVGKSSTLIKSIEEELRSIVLGSVQTNIPLLSKVKELANQLNLREKDLSTLIIENTGQHICGSDATGVKQPSAKNVELSQKIIEINKIIFSGPAKTISIQEIGRNGSNFVGDATLEKIARVNMAYGGVKDETPCDIEDSAHRIEPNDPLIGKIRCYSFYATKNMTTGSGGMLVTNNKEIYEKCRLYWKDGLSTSTYDRQHGKGWNYKVKAMSGGYDGNDIAAAIGRIQLKKLPRFIARRNEIRERYNQSLGQEWQGNHLYPYFVSSEKEIASFIGYMKDNGISCGYHYPPVRPEWLGISLPLYPDLTQTQIGYIIEVIKSWEAHNEKAKLQN